MRVLQIVTKPQRRGAEIFANQLNDWLHRHDLRVFTLYLYHYFGQDCLVPATNSTNCLADQRALWEKVPGLNPAILIQLHKALKLFRPDVVQANGGRALKYGAAAKLLFRDCGFSLNYRCIGSPQFWSKGFVNRHLTSAAVRYADGVVAVSDATLSELGRAPARQIRRRIHRGVDFSELRREPAISRGSLETPEQSQVLVFVGSLSEEKAPLRAVEILSRLRSAGHDVYLWMLGDGPLQQACEALAKERGVEGRLRMAGNVQRVGPYLASADIQLLTSDTEGLPGCLVEGAAWGLPIVAADVGGVKEIVADGITGYVVKADSIPDYVRCAQALLNDAAQQEMFREAALKHVEAFSLESIGPQYLELYLELIARRDHL